MGLKLLRNADISDISLHNNNKIHEEQFKIEANKTFMAYKNIRRQREEFNVTHSGLISRWLKHQYLQ
jgi:hypothetical protein